MPKSKILYFGNKLSGTGSIPTSAETLAIFLAADYDVVIYSSVKNQFLRLVHMIYGCVINRKKADLALIDTYSTSAFYFAFILSKFLSFFKVKYIPIIRGGSIKDRLESSPKMCHSLFYNAEINVCPSGFTENALEMAGYKTLLIPNSIPIENYRFNPARLFEDIALFYVRAIEKIYNPEMAIRVAKSLDEKKLKVSLGMVGPFKDNSIDDCKELVDQLALADRITFFGRLVKAEWIEKSEAYNVFINTTNVDNTPVSVIEAMALGLPVVSTNVGGIPFLLEDGVDALLVEPNDQEAMCRAIERLKSDPELVKQLTLNARKKVENFDWEVVKHKWKKLFDELSV